MNLKIGIIGLPNAGKSTLFNALLKKQVANVASYPFCTIEPNVGVVAVPDERLSKLADIVVAEHGGGPSTSLRMNRPPIVPAVVEFVDIAGLVKGASKGEGLGNKFLSHIREVDIICHVLRQFTDSDVVHVIGNIDANRDKDVVETELIFSDLETLKNQNAKFKNQNSNEKFKIEAVKKLLDGLNRGILAKNVSLSNEEEKSISDLHLLTMKPVLYVYNISEAQLSQNNNITMQQLNNGLYISAKIEAELAGLLDVEQKMYLKELGLTESGLDRLIKKAYEMLNLISFLTAGEIEVKAWTIQKGTKAPQAAGVIHTDFAKGFIKAEVVSFPELIKCGSWVKARETGKLRLEGKEYMICDGDVVEFKISVSK